MGRRIYENGKFVWKYVFGRQPSEMGRLADEFGIGKYEHRMERDEKEDIEIDVYQWLATDKDIPKLKKLLKQLGNGKTRKELEKIGMTAVKEFIQNQNQLWRDVFAEDIRKIEKAKSENGFPFYGSSNKGMNFEVYNIYSDAIEEEITDTFDFYSMIEAFIEYMETHKKTRYVFEDEL